MKQEFSNIKIRNGSNFEKLIIKIHVVKLLDDDQTLHSLYTKTFNEKPDVQIDGCIPKICQISPRTSNKESIHEFMFMLWRNYLQLLKHKQK